MNSVQKPICFWLTFCFTLSEALFISQLYPYGSQFGDQMLPNDVEDVSSSEIKLETSIKFFKRNHQSIFVNENGLLSFLTEVPSFFNIEFPALNYPIIAILYSDVDCRASGNIWYRNTNDKGILERAKQQIENAFQVQDFNPSEVFIATWDQVGYYEEKDRKVNTFQAVIGKNI